ncbi:MAG: protein kinase [Candidatus Sumerlaeia bacterium]|nr:protein kinase [Candidatus Sumerlaeia bacterium]
MTEQLRQLGPYVLQELLGYNGIFASFQGIDRKTNLPAVVLAVPKGEIVDSQVWEVFTEDVKELIEAGGNRLCRPYNYGEDQEHYWAAFEWMQGGHLGTVVRDHGLPDYVATFQWMAMLTEAFAALHRRGIIHRCLSPASIFINNHGDVRLLHSCWSILLLYTHTGLASPAMTSVLPFVAPEILSGENGEDSADVYSLGANLYFLLTGQPVHWHEDPVELARLAVESSPDFSLIPPELPQEARELLEELLQRDPGERPVNLPALTDRLNFIVDLMTNPDATEEPEGAEEALPNQAEIDADFGVMAHDDQAPGYTSGLPPKLNHPDLPPEDPNEDSAIRTNQPRLIEEEDISQKGKNLPKLVITAVAAVVILGGSLVIGMNIFGGASEPEPVAVEPVEQVEEHITEAEATAETAPEAVQLSEEKVEKYRQTSRSLRAVATMMIVHQREQGLSADQWASSIEDIEHLGTAEEFKDAWGREFEIRGSYIVSAGADGKFDNEDDVWFDVATGRPGGFSPTMAATRR